MRSTAHFNWHPLHPALFGATAEFRQTARAHTWAAECHRAAAVQRGVHLGLNETRLRSGNAIQYAQRGLIRRTEGEMATQSARVRLPRELGRSWRQTEQRIHQLVHDEEERYPEG